MNSYRPPINGPRGRLWVVGAHPPPGVTLPAANHACRFILCADPNEAIHLFLQSSPDMPVGAQPWVRPVTCVNLTVAPGLTRFLPPGTYLGAANADGSSAEDVGTHYDDASTELRMSIYLKRLEG